MNFFKKRATPAGLAQVLFETFVEDASSGPEIDLRIPDGLQPAVQAKTRVCRMIIVLLALVDQEKKDRRFCTIRDSLEALLFTTEREKDMPLTTELNRARRELYDLLFHQAKEGRGAFWARAWLSDLGIEETNPIRCLLVATYWVTLFTTVNNAVAEIGRRFRWD